jgi:protein-tyrosine phosphatase
VFLAFDGLNFGRFPMKTIAGENRRLSAFFKWCVLVLVCAALTGPAGGCGPGGVPRERSLNLKNAPNARDAGGYITRDGRMMGRKLLYRCGKLSAITQTECDVIQAAGIKTIIDLRSDEERQSAPDAECLFKFAEYKSLPIDVNASTRIEGYKAFITDADLADEISTIFSILAERDNLPVIIHCSAGKDRAGGMVALVHLLLGVNRDDIMADYLLSNQAGRDVKAKWLKAALDQLEAEGGIEAFLNNRGVGPEMQQAVRENLLEDRTDY